ncbi:RDD family protein [Streptomyces hainanensis]|uniref:RDD family protein n=1 Tax=Streptomyces hainanensis TaxID=402648 RepID=A0A4R4SQ64_9ACTN|nr:RDD family protein [Streptomyces hainanensis]TDC66047.1 RDD family protein [Streptomyces hainanensis]
MSQLVTGDAVVLGLQPARLPSRAMALLLDLVVIIGSYLLLSVVLVSTVLPLGPATAQAITVALLLLVLVGGPIAVETLSKGRSIGKAAFGLRVVRVDGGPIRFRHALVRGAVGFVEILLTAGTVACIASLVSAEGRRLGDVFGGTLVVRERLPGAAAASVPIPPPPPWLAEEFARLDLSRVPDPLWLAARQFLGRMGQLHQGVAWSMAAGLANDMTAWVGAAPPPGMPPAAYLAALVAERQRREAARVFGQAAVQPPTTFQPAPAPAPAATAPGVPAPVVAPEIPGAPGAAPPAGGFTPPS